MTDERSVADCNSPTTRSPNKKECQPRVSYCLKSIMTLLILIIVFIAVSCIISTSLIGFGFFYSNITDNIGKLREVNFESITMNTVSTIEKVSSLINNVQGTMNYVNFSSVDELRRYTWQTYRRASSDISVVTSFYCGVASGALAGYLADPVKSEIVFVTNYEDLRHFHLYSVTNFTTGQYEPTPEISQYLTNQTLYSSWYKAANETNTRRWTLSYTDTNLLDVMWITSSTSIRSENGKMTSWCSFDVATSSASEYLKTVASEVAGNVVTVIERQTGYMIACSDTRVQLYSIDEHGNTVRFSPIQSNNSLVRSSIEYATANYGSDLSGLRFERNMSDGVIYLHYESFRNKGRSILLNIGLVNDGHNLEWLIFQAIPKSSYYSSFYRSLYILAGVTVFIILVSFAVAGILGLLVTKPLRIISSEMSEIANMNFEEGESHRTWLGILSELDEMLQSLNQLKQGLKNFEKYVPAAVVQHVLRTNKQVQLGVAPIYATVMFLDIENFTTITEALQPSDLVNLMQEFFTNLSQIIIDHSGVIDKYMGDCIMSLFNAPTSVPDHEYQAVCAAMKMHESIQMLNLQWRDRSFPTIGIRVGINTANCLIGNVGSEQRVNYTALGDGVNIASRLEGLNKYYNTRTMIGPNTYEKVKHLFACRWISSVVLKGKSVATHAYEVMCSLEDATPEILSLCKLHLELRDSLDRDDLSAALQICEELVSQSVENAAAEEILERLKRPDFTKHSVRTDK